MKLSVISPTLNEAENVPRLVEEIGLALREIDYEILIVDDNSPDLTWSVAEKISASNARVRYLRRMQNPGLGLAVIDGFSAAEGDVIACIDADLQHDPAILLKMLDAYENGAEVVVGSRHIQGGGTGDWGRFRRIQSWMATRTAQLFLGIRLKDPMSGYFLFAREDFQAVKDKLNGKGFKILLEILAKLQPARVMEVPYVFRSRTNGESKLSSRVIWQYFQQVWRLCSSSRHFFIRFLKSVAIGGMGVIFNLGMMALLLRFSRIHNWRASAIASLAANMQNYLLQSACSYVSGAQRTVRKLDGYFSYLLMSAAGLVVATISYAGLAWTFSHTPVMHAGAVTFYTRLSLQFIAVVLGIRFNYALNHVFDWPDLSRLHLEEPAKAPVLR